MEVAERAIPGAEVIDREPHAEIPQAVERVDRPVEVVDDGAFRDLQLQKMRRKPGDRQDARHPPHDVWLAKLPGRDVDRHAEGHVREAAQEFGRLAAGLIEHPLADADDLAGLFGHRDELRRRDQPALPVLPADEGLHADHVAGRELDFGLVVQHKFPAVDRAAQPGLQLQAIRRVGVQFRPEDDKP